MNKLDMVYGFWENPEKSYRESGVDLDRYEFLKTYAGKPEILVSLRNVIMSDFVETPENVDKLGKLMDALEQASLKLPLHSTIHNLTTFIWGEEVQKDFSLSDFSFIENRIKEAEDFVIEAGIFGSVYSQEELGSERVKIIDVNNSDLNKILRFSDEERTIQWLTQYEEMAMQRDGSFVQHVYAFIMRGLRNGEFTLPVTFIRSGIGFDNAVKMCEVCVADDDTEFITLNKNKFHTNFSGEILNVFNPIGVSEMAVVLN